VKKGGARPLGPIPSGEIMPCVFMMVCLVITCFCLVLSLLIGCSGIGRLSLPLLRVEVLLLAVSGAILMTGSVTATSQKVVCLNAMRSLP
jgi:hypothetical protein